MSAKPLPSTTLLRERLSYDPDTGILRWRKRVAQCIRVGDIAGCVDQNGYWIVVFQGRQFKAHRLIWAIVHGAAPECEIDQIDGDGANNRLANLRLATHAQNLANAKIRSTNTSGVNGVHWRSRDRKWAAETHHDGRRITIGYFRSKRAAAAAYAAEARRLKGNFARLP